MRILFGGIPDGSPGNSPNRAELVPNYFRSISKEFLHVHIEAHKKGVMFAYTGTLGKGGKNQENSTLFHGEGVETHDFSVHVVYGRPLS